MISLVAVAATSGMKSTVSELVKALPASVPVMVAIPAVIEEMSVAVYVPLLLSVTAPSDPLVLVRITVPPLVVMLFPSSSISCTVITDIEVPLATILF